MRIVHRHILRSVMTPLGVNLLFFTFLFLMGKMLKITKLIINYQVEAGVIVRLLLYSIPHFLVFVLPMAVMMAVLLAFMRMAADNEILVLKSAGVSLYRMIPSALAVIGCGALATLTMTIYGMPLGKSAIKRLTYETLATHANVGLQARTFNNRFEKVTLYVNAVDSQTMQMRDIFIEDRRNPRAVATIVAPSGQLIRLPERRAVRLRLFNGVINQVERTEQSASVIHFATYDFEFHFKPADKLARYKRKDEDEMNLAELKAHIRSVRSDPDDYYEALNEYHIRFSIPAACLALGLLAIPLGVELKSNRKSAGLGTGLTLFVMYYVMMSAGRSLAEVGLVKPALGLWLPNAVFGTAGIVMLVRSANEKPLYWLDGLRFIGRAFVAAFQRLKRHWGRPRRARGGS
ncbi:MAG: LPS export ABC transporter permease LptF [Desulfobacterales bacterium]|nr:LPS export ABC transporter permease LptF [Desulfobacterales bacterium]MDJ0886982.1 LPS export ABC transporter permease LptF [Desulfobacterales bacterium]